MSGVREDFEWTTRRATAHLQRMSDWIDGAQVCSRDAITWGRIGKITEEAGEVVQALIGVTGQNPRKGMTHTWDDVQKELLDVAVTALGAYMHVEGPNGRDVMTELDRHIEAVCERAGLNESW